VFSSVRARQLVADLLEVVSHLADLLGVHAGGHVLVVGAHDTGLARLEDDDTALAGLAAHHLLVVAQVHELLARDHDAGRTEPGVVVEARDWGASTDVREHRLRVQRAGARRTGEKGTSGKQRAGGRRGRSAAGGALTDRGALLGGDSEAAGPRGAVQADDAPVLDLTGGLEVVYVRLREHTRGPPCR
jgi:hypothetical protein